MTRLRRRKHQASVEVQIEEARGELPSAEVDPQRALGAGVATPAAGDDPPRLDEQ